MFTFRVVFKLYFRLHKFPSCNRHIGSRHTTDLRVCGNAKNILLPLLLIDIDIECCLLCEYS